MRFRCKGSALSYWAVYSLMPNLHRRPDKTKQFCRVRRAGVNWKNATDVFRLQIFCRRQS